MAGNEPNNQTHKQRMPRERPWALFNSIELADSFLRLDGDHYPSFPNEFASP